MSEQLKRVQVGRNKMSFEPTELQWFIIDIFDFHQIHVVERAQKEFLEQWVEPEDSENILGIIATLDQDQLDYLADPDNHQEVERTIPVPLLKWVNDLADRMF